MLRLLPVGSAIAAFILAGCSDPVPPAPRGNLNFNVSSCTTYSGAVGPDRSTDPNTRFSQLVADDGTRPGRRLEDGQEGASIRCTVDGGDTSRIEARLFGVQSHPSAQIIETVGMVITDGFISKETGEGQAHISLNAGVVYEPEPGSICTLSINSSRTGNQFTVDAGRVYASFDCQRMQNLPVTGCKAKGAFVLERCEEDD